LINSHSKHYLVKIKWKNFQVILLSALFWKSKDSLQAKKESTFFQGLIFIQMSSNFSWVNLSILESYCEFFRFFWNRKVYTLFSAYLIMLVIMVNYFQEFWSWFKVVTFSLASIIHWVFIKIYIWPFWLTLINFPYFI
jgi:hypothetical protein